MLEVNAIDKEPRRIKVAKHGAHVLSTMCCGKCTSVTTHLKQTYVPSVIDRPLDLAAYFKELITLILLLLFWLYAPNFVKMICKAFRPVSLRIGELCPAVLSKQIQLPWLQ